MKVAIGPGVAGFGISLEVLNYLIANNVTEAQNEYNDFCDITEEDGDASFFNTIVDSESFSVHSLERHNPFLLEAIEKFPSEKRNIKIVEIPDDVEYEIYDAEDGSESIHEKHRVWR